MKELNDLQLLALQQDDSRTNDVANTGECENTGICG